MLSARLSARAHATARACSRFVARRRQLRPPAAAAAAASLPSAQGRDRTRRAPRAAHRSSAALRAAARPRLTALPPLCQPAESSSIFFSTRSLILPPTKHAAGSEGALWPTVFSPQPTATRLKAPCSRMPHHADPATPGPRVTGPAGLSIEFSWGGRMPSPRGWTPMSAHFEAAPSQNSQTRVLPMSQDRGLSVFNQSMPMTEPRF